MLVLHGSSEFFSSVLGPPIFLKLSSLDMRTGRNNVPPSVPQSGSPGPPVTLGTQIRTALEAHILGENP